MLFGLVIALHILIALFLIAVILLQGGRGGLGEALGGAAAQSLFGGGANIVMTRLTAICAGLFMVTCLSLAMLSTAKGRSVVERIPEMPAGLPGVLPPLAPQDETAPRKPAPVTTSVGEAEQVPPPAPAAPAPAAPTPASPPSAAPAQPATPAPGSSSTTP